MNQDLEDKLKQSLIAIRKLKKELGDLQALQQGDIAVVGMSCRFPGNVYSPTDFWKLLVQRKGAISEVPSTRWNAKEFFDKDPASRGKTYSNAGGFLREVDLFDPGFFEISPREAAAMDPQQRLLLELAWEAFENAHLPSEKVRGSRTGVFLGISHSDYMYLRAVSGSYDDIDMYDGTGVSSSSASGRLSYFFDLKGPSVSVDTACSSSLVALHLACQSLLRGESDMGLVGGVNLLLNPKGYIALSKMGALSRSGRCSPFDIAADGFVRGEGGGAVLVKRLQDAVRDGNNILAVIRGTSVNQDGKTNGMTAPNGRSQEQVIREALKKSGVAPADVSYVETHGTGTSLGDPIEYEAISKVFGEGRAPGRKLYIGAVKSNLGHLEAAAGMAGLIKTILSLQHRTIVPNLRFDAPGQFIQWKEFIQVPTQLVPFSDTSKPFIAGVSSFGFSGSNAHVVLQEAPFAESIAEEASADYHVLALSAKNEKSLWELAERYYHFLQKYDVSLPALCTANVARDHWECRIALAGSSVREIKDRLKDIISAGPATHRKPRREYGKLPVSFLFTGQGAQYPGMGKALYDSQPVFREWIDRCNEILKAYMDIPLLTVLYGTGKEAEYIHETLYTQPALFALEYALFQWWKSVGVNPDAVMGHSIGEFAAACAARVFTLEDGLKLVAHRGKLMQSVTEQGAMLAVFTTEEKAAAAIQPFREYVSIAAVNSVGEVVLSGKAAMVKEAGEALEAGGVKTKWLQVSHAFHSPLMREIMAEFEQVARSVTYSAPGIKIISNVTGAFIQEEIARPEYWVNHILAPVQYYKGITTLDQSGIGGYLEIGPHPVLVALARPSVEGEKLWLPSLRKTDTDSATLMKSLASLYTSGINIRWDMLCSKRLSPLICLPNYPFQRTKHWIRNQRASGRYLAGSEDSAPAESAIMKALRESDSEELLSRLEVSTHLSPELRRLMPMFVKVLIEQHSRQLPDTGDHEYYGLKWVETKSETRAQDLRGTGSAGTWLVFDNGTAVGKALTAFMEQRSKKVMRVAAGKKYKKKNGNVFEVNPGDRADLELLVAGAAADSGKVEGVLFLWGLPDNEKRDLVLPRILEKQKLFYSGLLHIISSLASRNIVAPLWMITSQAVAVGDAPCDIALEQSLLWGMAKALSLELPSMWGGIIDLEAGDTLAEETCIKIVDSILHPDGEEYIAVRDGKRFVQRLVKVVPGLQPAPAMDPNATYLITGGCGGIGLEIASWMVERGARHIMLTGRGSALTEKANAVLDRLRNLGAIMEVMKADVADAQDMQALFENIDRSGRVLKGVVHAAGVPGYHLFKTIEYTEAEAVLRPKVTGGWLLHEHTRNRELDFFVCFSSIASVWGSKGQIHYAGANQFLDALAHYRQKQGLPAVSVNWGPWEGGGMASEEGRSFLRKMGIRSLTPEEGVAAFERLLNSDCAQAAVASVDWAVFGEHYNFERKHPLLSEVLERVVYAEQKKESPSHTAILKKLNQATVSEKRYLLVSYLKDQLEQVIGLEKGTLAVEQPMNTTGMDSMMAVEVKSRIRADLGMTIDVTWFMQDVTTAGLAEKLLSLLQEDNGGNQEQESNIKKPSAQHTAKDENLNAGTARELLACADDLSEEELDRLLNLTSPGGEGEERIKG